MLRCAKANYDWSALHTMYIICDTAHTDHFIMASDQSPYMLEFRILAACWWHESDQSKNAMRQVRQRLQERFTAEIPRGRNIREWEEKLFSTGSLADAERSGRPCSRKRHHSSVNCSLLRSPKKSLRKRSAELKIPVATLERIVKDDLQCKPWKPVHVQFLMEADHNLRVTNCKEILFRCPTPQLKNRVFFLR
jgi:hypothetical protein